MPHVQLFIMIDKQSGVHLDTR